MEQNARIIKNGEGIEDRDWKLVYGPECLYGKRSDEFYIGFEEIVNEIDADDKWLTLWLNRNEARYLCNALLAFINEEELGEPEVFYQKPSVVKVKKIEPTISIEVQRENTRRKK